MKFQLILVAVLLLSQALFAQKELTTIKIAVPPSGELITAAVQTQLENKLGNVLSANDIVEGFNTQILLVPKVSINDKTVAEGMQKLTVVKFELNLQIINWTNKDVFASQSITLTGSGSSDSEALRNAVSKIKPSDARIKAFLKSASIKIQEYYQNECEHLMVEAEQLAKAKKYDAALVILSSIPSGANCYNEAHSKTSTLYEKHQQQYCNQYLQQAKTNAANTNYSAALYYLSQIDRESPCVREADALLTQIGAKVEEKNKMEWESLKKRQEKDADIEKVRSEILNKILENHYKQKVIVIEG